MCLQEIGNSTSLFLFIDRLDTKHGVRAYLDGRKMLLAALKESLAAINADVFRIVFAET